MRVQVKLRILSDDGTLISEDEVLHLDKASDQIETIGLSLAEAKTLMASTQNHLVSAQAAAYVAKHRCCTTCGRRLRGKGHSSLVFHTAFGVLHLNSPRYYHCGCQPAANKTFSPLTELLSGHDAPELLYLEAKWASLVSYCLTADLLKEVLPIGTSANASTIRNHLHRVAGRRETELAREQHSFIQGCPADWKLLPVPEGPIIVGIDGGYVRGWDDKKSNFEVIVGKSVPEERDDRYFGFVQTVNAGVIGGQCAGVKGSHLDRRLGAVVPVFHGRDPRGERRAPHEAGGGPPLGGPCGKRGRALAA